MIRIIRAYAPIRIGAMVGVMALLAPVCFAQAPLAEYRQLEDRIRIIERLLASEGLIRLHDDLKKLGQELRQLRGIVEQDNRAIESIKNSQIKQYQSLDSQLLQLGEGIEQLKESFRQLQAKVEVLETARGQVLKRLAASLSSAPPTSVSDSTASDTADGAAAGMAVETVADVDDSTAVVAASPPLVAQTQDPDSGTAAVIVAAPALALASTTESSPAATISAVLSPATVVTGALSATVAVPANLAATATVVTVAPASTDSASVFDELLSEQQAYREAFELLKNGHYGRATRAFRAFVVQYPESELAGNAQYWLGESLYVEREFAKAMEEFKRVLSQYPESPKLTHAMLKIGFIYSELGQLGEARKVLTEISQSYPDSTVASLALRRLKRLADQ